MQEALRENVAIWVPVVTEFEKPFWDSLQNEKILLVQVCEECGNVQFPPSPVCTSCLTDKVSWKPCSGKATLWSKVAFHKQYLEPYPDVPYSVAIAKLEEGPLVTGRITNENANKTPIDAPLKAQYIQTVDGTVLLEFVPV